MAQFWNRVIRKRKRNCSSAILQLAWFGEENVSECFRNIFETREEASSQSLRAKKKKTDRPFKSGGRSTNYCDNFNNEAKLKFKLFLEWQRKRLFTDWGRLFSFFTQIKFVCRYGIIVLSISVLMKNCMTFATRLISNLIIWVNWSDLMGSVL